MKLIFSKSTGFLLFFYAVIVIYQALPIPMIRFIGGFPLENFLYLIAIFIAFANLLKVSFEFNFITLFYSLILFLIAYGYIVNRDYQYYSSRILFLDLRACSGLLVGYVIARRYNTGILIQKLFNLAFIVSMLLLLSYPLIDFGLIKVVSLERKFLANHFYIALFLQTVLPILFFYFVKKNDKSRIRLTLLFYAILIVFAIRSGTRSTLLLALFSFMGSLYLTGYLRKLLIPIIVSIILFLPQLSNLTVVSRVQKTNLDNEARVFEVLMLIEDFKNYASPIFGFGVGVGLVKPELGPRSKGKIVFGSHVGVLNFFYKGGFLLGLLFLFPFFKYIFKGLKTKIIYIKVLSFALILYYLQSFMSGGYGFPYLCLMGIILGLFKMNPASFLEKEKSTNLLKFI